jgi:acyl-CoA synthetase (AMP-forming)/AMP-acid ligase II
MHTSNFTLYQLFQHNAQVYGDSTAFISTYGSINFRQFLNTVDRLAAGLTANNIGAGDRVCILAHRQRKNRCDILSSQLALV